MGKLVYEYAVIRILPKVEREEFVNAGVILFSKHGRFLEMRYRINEARLAAFVPDEKFDLELVRRTLESFDLICRGKEEGGPIAQLDQAERFRWITAIRSSCVQTSPSHAGLSDDMPATLGRLFQELIL